MKPCVDARQSFNHVTAPTESKFQTSTEKQQKCKKIPNYIDSDFGFTLCKKMCMQH